MRKVENEVVIIAATTNRMLGEFQAADTRVGEAKCQVYLQQDGREGNTKESVTKSMAKSTQKSTGKIRRKM